MPLPDALDLTPTGPVDLDLSVPGSKSLTNRALLIAALADGESQLEGALRAEDSEVMIRALRALGFEVDVDGTTVRVRGHAGDIPAEGAELDLQLSGTSIRFLTALVALGRGRYRLDGNARMRERPIGDLLAALRALGARARGERDHGFPPVIVEAEGLAGGRAEIPGDRSSQYLSALAMVAPAARAPVTLQATGTLQSRPFVDMTLAVMATFGVTAEREGDDSIEVAPARYRARRYRIEGDAMAAGYFWAAAAATGGRVRVRNVGEKSLQGDRRFSEVLERMGCRVRWRAEGGEVTGPPAARLAGGTFDLNEMPDQAQTLAVLGLFAQEPVRIENVWNLRIKETDRLRALARELGKFGARVREEEAAITVWPLRPGAYPGAAQVDTYGDHRMAMAFALAGLRLPGVTLREPGCVAKTYPGFFDDWARLGGVALS